MEKSTVLVVILVALVVLSGMQTIAIMGLSGEPDNAAGRVTIAQGKTRYASPDDMSGHHPDSQSPQSPQMVGGC